MENSVKNANQFYFFFRPRKIRTMQIKSDNVEITMGNETDDIIKELLKSFLEKYQKKLQEKMKDSKFAFESVE